MSHLANIKGRALQGLARVFGTTGDQPPSPLSIDMAAPVSTVYDVGPGAHARSRWLQDGWVLFEHQQAHAGAGTQQDTILLLDAMTSPVLFDNPVRDASSTALWIVTANIILDVNSGLVADYTSGGILTRQPGLRSLTATLNNNDYTNVVKFTNGAFPFNVPGGVAGLRITRDTASNTQEETDRGMMIRVGPEDSVLFQSTVGGALDVYFNLLCFVGSDGLPPPNAGY